MSLYGASPTQLTTAAGYCQDTAQYIEGMRQRVVEIKAGLQWQGGAYKKFSEAMDQWDVEFKGVIKILEGIYDKLNIGAGVYRNAADQNMDIVGGFASAGASGGRIDSLINANNGS
ncbi:WXG100 family type VII secretion target [Nonomuraea wenchangensis]|uniref:WXG100 family type VII secretion target n=1 Tax=Nonomuraea wenchangensis TaxID=568860 RepID=A0A1I0LC22_9ACTN|nr:WXG100 family type VII secretion target [Nonomuraea wenchangensis]SEU36850.1 WXG100 family type VII secretion target [Nonomuraea wenchangensis]